MNEPKHQPSTAHLGPILGPHKGDPLSRSMNEPTREQPMKTEPELLLNQLAERFISWPLPESVCADLCTTKAGYTGRTGTNLLTFDEAKQMLAYVLADHFPEPTREQLEADCAAMREALEWLCEHHLDPRIAKQVHHLLSTDSGSALLEEVRRLRENSDRLAAALEKWQHVWKETESEWDDCDAASKQADEALAAHRKGEKQ